MSGGQQQRVGIARAFVSNPEIVFAAEPTGNLDSKTSKEIMELIKQMSKENNQTIVMVTHDESIAQYANKIVHIHDGHIEKIVEVKEDEEGYPERGVEPHEQRVEKTFGKREGRLGGARTVAHAPREQTGHNGTPRQREREQTSGNGVEQRPFEQGERGAAVGTQHATSLHGPAVEVLKGVVVLLFLHSGWLLTAY